MTAPTRSPHHFLLLRKHPQTGEVAYHYCHVPPGRSVPLMTLVRVACLRWPVEEEDFEFGKDHLGLDHSQVHRYTALNRHLVLAMAALAVCAVTAAQAKTRAPRTDPAHHPGRTPTRGHRPDRVHHRRDQTPVHPHHPPATAVHRLKAPGGWTELGGTCDAGRRVRAFPPVPDVGPLSPCPRLARRGLGWRRGPRARHG
jgi:hypothetical protein